MAGRTWLKGEGYKAGDTPLCLSMGDGRLLSSILGGLHEDVPLLDEKAANI